MQERGERGANFTKSGDDVAREGCEGERQLWLVWQVGELIVVTNCGMVNRVGLRQGGMS